MTKQKVFCIGFQKTGTTSMETALSILGYRVHSIFGNDLPLDELRRSYITRGLEIAGGCDAVEDMPWPLMFRELDQEFPGSKFILTWRDSDRWLRSICSHFGANPAVLQQLTYGENAPYPVGHEDRYREVYEAHNAAVREYFADRPGDLLEIDLTIGASWTTLCAFLNVPVPAVPFPVSNSAQTRSSLRRRIVKRLQKSYSTLSG